MPSMPGVLSSSSGVGHAVETDHSRRIRMSGNENMTFGPKGYDKRVHGSAARTDRGYAAARPFLKWAGGKQQLLADYEQYFPTGFHRYFEPFLGGGAVFFHLRKTGRLPGAAYLFDNNEELINAYIMVRDNPDELIKILVTCIPPLSLNCTGNFGLRSALNNRYFLSLNIPIKGLKVNIAEVILSLVT